MENLIKGQQTQQETKDEGRQAKKALKVKPLNSEWMPTVTERPVQA